MTYLFLDTNIYLHCKDYEQLPWGQIIPNTEQFTIVVPPITLSEIDKIKDRGTGKVNKKARDFSKRFNKILLDGARSKIPVITCNAPKAKDYEEYDLDRVSQDNQFVLSAILYQKTTGNDVLIVARDTNLCLTAKARSLKYLFLPDEYCLTPELSEEEKELSKVKKELARLTNRLSKPSLTFDNGEVFINVKKTINRETEEIIRDTLQEEWRSVPYINEQPQDSALLSSKTWLAVQSIKYSNVPQTEIDRYNKEVDDYQVEYEEYVRSNADSEALKARMHEIKIVVFNNGNAPTGDLEIFINFPSHVKLYDRTCQKPFDASVPPIKPEPPSLIAYRGGASWVCRALIHHIQP